MRAKTFADGSNQEKKTHPEFEQHLPINFDPKLNKKGKGRSQLKARISICQLPGCYLCYACPTMRHCTVLNHSSNESSSHELISVRHLQAKRRQGPELYWVGKSSYQDSTGWRSCGEVFTPRFYWVEVM